MEIKRELRVRGALTLETVQGQGQQQLQTAQQPGHRKTAADRLNDVLIGMGLRDKVESGVWGVEVDREVPDDELNDAERREVKRTGARPVERRLVGQSPYTIQRMEDGRVVIRVQMPDTSVQVGIGNTMDDAIDDLMRRVGGVQ